MGIFYGMFGKKEKTNNEVANNNVVNNGVVDNTVVTNEVVNNVMPQQTANVVPNPVVQEEPVNNDVARIVMNSQSSVLEQMQNRYVEESAQEAERVANEPDAMSIFNQNIELDSSNPMAIFGAVSEENNQDTESNQ